METKVMFSTLRTHDTIPGAYTRILYRSDDHDFGTAVVIMPDKSMRFDPFGGANREDALRMYTAFVSGLATGDYW